MTVRLLSIFIVLIMHALSGYGQSAPVHGPDLNGLRVIVNDRHVPIDEYKRKFDFVMLSRNMNSEAALEVVSEAIRVSSNNKDTMRLAWSTYYHAELLRNRLNEDEARELLTTAQSLFNEIGDRCGELRCIYGQAYFLLSAGRYSGAAPAIQQALHGAEGCKDTVLLIHALKSLGFISGMQQNRERAIGYYREGIRYAQMIHWPSQEIDLTRSVGNAFTENGQYELGLNYLERADSLLNADDPTNQYMRAVLLTEIGLIEVNELNQIESGLEKFYEAEKVFDSAKKYHWLSYAQAKIAQVYLKQGKTEEAMKKALDGYQLAIRYNFSKERHDNLEILYKASVAQKKYEQALNYHIEMKVLMDSMANQESVDKLVSMELTFAHEKQMMADSVEFARKSAEVQMERERESDRQRVIRNSIAAGFIGALIFLIVVYRQRNKISIARKRSDELLLNILPEEVAEELKSKGEAEAVYMDQVSVLFTDFKGFTAMSEVVTPRQLVNDLHECFSAFDRIVEKHGIEKIKTIGDAYMAAGGLPTPNSTHAVDVVRAALEMVKFIEEARIKRLDEGSPYFEIRVGVHTGPVVAGIVGVKKFQYDIWGDTVNTASRMESSGAPGKVNISQSTYERVKGHPDFIFEERGMISAKGKGEMKMYFVSPA